MPRGGRREGAGRPTGAANRKTRETADKAAAAGLSPMAYLLAVMADETADSHRRDQAAKELLPYMHPRLLALAPRRDFRGEPTENTNVFVEQITILPVESGRFLSRQEAIEPLIEVLDEVEPIEDAAPEGPADAA
jgi:hypothetical protein